MFFLSVSVVGITSCGVDVPKETPTSFETMTVSKSDITIPLHYSARLKGKTDVTVTPQVSGQLLEICVHEGQQVHRGQVLFRIDDRQARLDLENAQANLEAAQAMESSAQLELQSTQNLFDKGIVSTYMLNAAQNAYSQAKAATSQARSRVNSCSVQLGYCTIASPVTGLVGTIPASTGAQVSPSYVLTTLSDNDHMRAAFSVTEDEINLILSENPDPEAYLNNLPDVTFIMKDGTEYPHKGRVLSSTGTVESSTGTIVCKVDFPNPEGKLLSGMQGTVVLPYSLTDVMVIPQCAVVRLLDRSLVYKVGADSCAVSTQVTVADAATGKDFVVLSGLEPGDRIVTVGANNVAEGQQVLF